MVQGDDGGNDLFESLDSPAETLIVMNEVKLVSARCEVAMYAGAEGQWFRKHTGREDTDLKEIFASFEFPKCGETAGIVVVEEVEAWQFGEGDALMEDGVRLAAEYFDLMSEIEERFREMAGVDPLAANMGLSSVREVGDPQGTVWIKTLRHPCKAIGRSYRRVVGAIGSLMMV